MTPKQQAFCREYQIDGNATQAAIRAGYSARTAYSAGHRLLKNVEVAQRIIGEREAIWDSQAMGISEAVAEMSGLARMNFADVATVASPDDIMMLDRRTSAAIKSVTFKDGGTKITLHDKKGALDSMFRKHKLLVDRVELRASEDFAGCCQSNGNLSPRGAGSPNPGWDYPMTARHWAKATERLSR